MDMKQALETEAASNRPAAQFAQYILDEYTQKEN